MIPDYVEQEAELRLGDIYDRSWPLPAKIQLIERAGIDLEAARDPRPTPEEALNYIRLSDEDGEPLIGGIEFEMRIEALGRTATQKLRMSYLVTPLSDEERAKDDGKYLFGCAFVNFDVLLWESEEDRDEEGTPLRMGAPVWQSLDPCPAGFIPPEIRRQADDLMTAQVLAWTRTKKSNS